MWNRINTRTVWTASIVFVMIGGLGVVLLLLPGVHHQPKRVVSQPAPARVASDPRADPAGHAREAQEAEIKKRFDEAVTMLHAREYDHAIASLHRVLELRPTMPEAHVNMGFALIGKEQFAAARDFFSGAIDLNPSQANAYYGLAVTHEALGQLPEAVGAMRTFVHLEQSESRFRRKAESAIWEWEAALASGAASGGAPTTHSLPAGHPPANPANPN